MAAVLITQAVTAGLLKYVYFDTRGQPELTRVLDSVALTLDPASTGRFVRALVHADLEHLFVFVIGLVTAAYVILRAPASGYRSPDWRSAGATASAYRASLPSCWARSRFSPRI